MNNDYGKDLMFIPIICSDFSLMDLCEPIIPSNLKKDYAVLDHVVKKLYCKPSFNSDPNKLEFYYQNISK